MEPEKWSRTKELFSAALELDRERRAAFLQQACGEDRALRSEIESLLAFHEATQDDTANPNPQPDSTDATLSNDARFSADQRIGPYQVIHEIGRGGMAIVYLAVRADAEFRKRVAIKLVRQGMEEEILRRFRNERQTLAGLDHPNIVKLLDGGHTSEGWPYLVMEYVEGLPIDEYCDSRRLTVSDRVRLFCTVCDAVHYAHQNLVIHRDLKPSNILVTSAGTAKLLDFGIAKLLNPEFSAQSLLVTQPGAWVMTPEYASPEQIRGLPITTATDIYSLGVMLYHLLSGHRPYRLHSGTPLELERAICEEEPEAPSTAIRRSSEADAPARPPSVSDEAANRTAHGSAEKLRRQLSGDLDNIVLTALRKEPQRRYASVLQLADDLRRHLAGLPVTARKATLGYRSSKFVRRNRVAVVAAALIIVALSVGLAVATWEAHVARQEKAIAEARFNDLHKLADSFLFDFDNAIKNLRGSNPVRALIVRKALDYLNRLSQQSGNNAALQEDLVHAYLKTGDIQGSPYSSSLGDLRGALNSYTKAQELASGLNRAHPNNPKYAELLAFAHMRIAGVQVFSGKPKDAVENLHRALALIKDAQVEDPQQLALQLDVVDCYMQLGDAYGHGSVLNLGLPDKALEYFQQALTLARETLEAHPGDLGILRRIATAESKAGDILLGQGHLDDAIVYHRRSMDDFATILLADPNNGRAKRELGAAYNRFGETLLQRGQRAESLALFRKSLATSEDLLAGDPTDANAKFDVAVSLRNLSEAQAAAGDLTGAIANFRSAIRIVSGLCAADPTNQQRKAQLAEGLVSFGKLLARAGHTAEARAETDRGLTMQRALDAGADNMAKTH